MGNLGKPQSGVFNGKLIMEDANNRLVLYNGNLVKLLIGLDAAGNVVVKIADSTHSADTATNSQLIFNSSQDVLKVVSHNTVTLTPPNSGSPNFTITAGGFSTSVDLTSLGLTSPPGVIAYFKAASILNWGDGSPILSSNYQSMPMFALLGAVSISIFYTITNTALTFWFEQIGGNVNWTPAQSIDFSYYILQESVT